MSVKEPDSSFAHENSVSFFANKKTINLDCENLNKKVLDNLKNDSEDQKQFIQKRLDDDFKEQINLLQLKTQDFLN